MLTWCLWLATALAADDYEAFIQAYSQGELDRAETLARSLLAERTASLGPEDLAVAEMMSDLGAVRRAQGAVHEAVRLTSRALDIHAEAGTLDTPEALPIRNNLALMHQQLGHAALALEGLEEVVRLRRELDEPAALATSLNNLGTLLQAEGDLARAERLYTEAISLAQHPVDQAEFQLNLASALEERRELQASQELSMLALAQLRQHLPPEHPTFAATVINVAVGLLNGGGPEQAARAHELLSELEARLTEADASHPLRHHVRALLGKLALDQGHPEQAIALLTPALRALESQLGADAYLSRGSREWLAQALLVSGQPEVARALVGELLGERMADGRTVMAQLSDRAALAWVALDRRWLDLWLQTWEPGADPTRTWELAMAYKGAATRSAQDQRTWLRSLHDPEVDERLSELAAVRSALADTAWAAGAAADTAVLAERLDALEAELSRLAGERVLEQPTVASLCAALGPEEVLVDWLRLHDRLGSLNGRGDRYRVWTLRGGDCTVTEAQVAAGPLEDAAARWRQQLGSTSPSPARTRQLGQATWEASWAAVAPAIDDAHTVWLVPDGVLAHLGLAALPDPDGTYLVEQHELRLLEHPQQLQTPTVQRGGRGAVVVADVHYGGAIAARTRSCVGGELAALPGTAVEARAVTRGLRRAHRGPITRLTGTDATEAAVEEAATRSSWLHLATHGFFGESDCLSRDEAQARFSDPLLRSGLVLAADGQRDGVWTAQEVAALDLRGLDGVVLSACDTGLGELASGEGVIGLRRAFALSGVRHQIMSLWAVPDADTATLMSALYQRLDEHPAAALRQAQLDLLVQQRAERREDPRSWGAFVVVGR